MRYLRSWQFEDTDTPCVVMCGPTSTFSRWTLIWVRNFVSLIFAFN